MSIPKPIFAACDETSLKLKADFKVEANREMFIQCKLPQVDWTQAKNISVNNQSSIALADIVDLEPGTAYNVRFMLKNTVDNSCEYGPDTIFDTKPIDCTPKGNSCIVC